MDEVTPKSLRRQSGIAVSDQEARRKVREELRYKSGITTSDQEVDRVMKQRGFGKSAWTKMGKGK